MSKLQVFNQFLTGEKVQNYLSQVLGQKKESFVTTVTSLVSNNVALQNCVPITIMYSAIKATSLGLPLDNNLGFAYVLPYNNTKKGVQEAQFQIGYKGFIQLAMRSGQFKTINSTDVRDGEKIGINRLTGEIEFNWLSDEERKDKKIIGYVAYFELTNGFQKSFYMSIDELEKHGKKYSKSYNSAYSNWKKMFDAMASKTVIKLLLSKFAPMSIQTIHDAVKYDQSVIRGENEAQYIDVNTVDYDEIEKEIRELKDTLNLTDEDSLYIDSVLEDKDIEKYEKILNNLKVEKKKSKMNNKAKLP